ncbi:MAG TPA: glyoxalase/bleomycin resistance/extradiol dioxygenase family protein [Paracoccaceae bacterium]|nr:glyoxalase/bleomycin resistance/extradiol dioxygenase family protein [Paracoccaceae bacterium]HMO73253.1 glyoxalase/bleomycin resistance/extradiol dioxygenase family protein [Paracoccaceae bacterium]
MADTAVHPRPDPRVMQGVIPYLNLRGRAAEAADFYIRAFGATDLGRMAHDSVPGMPGTPGHLLHAQIEINGGALMMTDHMDAGGDTAAGPMPSGHLQLVVGDGRAWWDRALAAGCTEVMPFGPQPWGDDWGLMVDPFGIHWAILQPGPESA